MRICIQRPRRERLLRQLFGFLGVGIRLVELPGHQIAARKPRQRLEKLRRDPALRAIALKDRFGQRKIAVRHRSLDVGDDTGHGRNGEQTRGNQLPLHLH